MSNNTATMNSVGVDDLMLQMQIAQATLATLYILADPGTGKTSIDRQVAVQRLRKHGAEANYVYVNGSTKTAEFFGMSVPLVKNGSCDFYIAEWFRKLANMKHAHLCVDEFDKLSFRDQAPFLQLASERGIDGTRLGDGVTMSFLGNFRTNGNGSNGFSNIATNKGSVVHFRPEPHRVHQYLVAVGAHPWVTSYLLENPHRTNAFNPLNERNCTSRQWEWVSRNLSALMEISPNPSARHVVQTVATRVPDDVAQEFTIMTELQQQIVPTHEVFADPKGCRKPNTEDRGVHWLQVNTIASRAAGMKMNEKFNGLTRTQCKVAAFLYAERFAPEFLNAILPMIQSLPIDDPNYSPDKQAIPSQLMSHDILANKLRENARLIEEK